MSSVFYLSVETLKFFKVLRVGGGKICPLGVCGGFGRAHSKFAAFSKSVKLADVL